MFLKIFIFILIGLCGGVIGGMGMGGGTLLIPMLTIFTDTNQHLAQAINLIAFVPMSIAALIIHAKNKLIEYKYIPLMAIPAVLCSVFSAMLSKKIEGASLKMYFGIFLIVLGVYQLVCAIVSIVKKYKEKKETVTERYTSEKSDKSLASYTDNKK